MPERTRAERLDAYAASLRALNALGLTGGHVMLGWPWLLDDLETLEARGDLTLRCVVPLLFEPGVTDEEIEALLAHRDRRGRRWRGGVAKFFIDGVIDSGTAWLFEPGPRGEGDAAVLARSRTATPRSSARCRPRRVPVRDARDRRPRGGGGARRLPRRRARAAPPRTGSSTSRRCATPSSRGSPPRASRRRCSRCTPRGSTSPGRSTGATSSGPRRPPAGFRWGDIRRSGAILALGSDWPVVSADPRLGLAWARLRRAPGRPERTPFRPDQRLGALEALEGYTTEAARVVGEEHLTADRARACAPTSRASAPTRSTAPPTSCPTCPCS